MSGRVRAARQAQAGDPNAQPAQRRKRRSLLGMLNPLRLLKRKD